MCSCHSSSIKCGYGDQSSVNNENSLKKVSDAGHPVQFLEVAINGQAEVIITGDKDLLILHPCQSIQILTPAQYLNNK